MYKMINKNDRLSNWLDDSKLPYYTLIQNNFHLHIFELSKNLTKIH